MIKLPVQTNFAGLESFIRDVRQNPGQDLALPVQVQRGGSFGFSALSVQAVATWARLHTGLRRLRLSPSYAASEETRERFAGNLMGMAGIYFSDEVVSGGETISRRVALDSVAPRVFAMEDYRYRDTLRGRAVALCCFEKAKLEFVKPLYALRQRSIGGQSSVRDVAEFRLILVAALEACSSSLARRLRSDQVDFLGQLVHQLFKNADIHTLVDARQESYESGLRGVFIREVAVNDPNAFSEFASDDRALLSYFSKLKLRPLLRGEAAGVKNVEVGSWRPTAFVEISIFDTGPGLALRWLSKKKGYTSYEDFDREEEMGALKECFELHASTQNSAMRGDGLTIALAALSELRAFMFLRTGRLSIYQDFSVGNPRQFLPRNRFPNRSLGEAAGATYSICFPVVK